ncbi:hypothetical protein Y032_0587g348 [Ancylostoma ceylanicum]|uniref:Uncharacterized protein n=1 Tax=Ancylostoma ceylanicum TaxID=53326 RepID=A0A016WPN5_9BILA|nr:hypothetical protein Y032_0587g348 [Ancylostoma ceylanicum]
MVSRYPPPTHLRTSFTVWLTVTATAALLRNHTQSEEATDTGETLAVHATIVDKQVASQLHAEKAIF